ncbi:MAG: hypothetical protein ACK46Q_06260 [Hyphomonas sp.]
MRRLLACLAVSAALPFVMAVGDPEIDDIVRLPGETQRANGGPPQPKGMRYVPAGGLFASFDTNEDGKITREELVTGIHAAFTEADINEDGNLSALEQQAWAANLPVRDDTLANPVRFDPNLDRIVTFEEFESILLQLAENYQDENGNIPVKSLLVPEKEERRNGMMGPRGMPPSQR